MSEHAFQLRVVFLSDWCIGSGDGIAGHIDALVRRDPRDELPFVPAKTLRGIWRDLCEQVAAGLDGDSGEGWQNLVDALFGRESSATAAPGAYVTSSDGRLRLAPAHFSTPLRGRLAESAPLREALFLVKPGVSVDRDTATARSRHLRLTERVVAGCVLEAEGSVDLAGCNDIPGALAFLAQTAARIERMGGERRRGAGRCEVGLVFTKKQGDIVPSAKLPEAAPRTVAAARDAAAAPTPEAAAATDDWLHLRVDLDLLTPVAVPEATLGNVVTSRDCISGSHLLPALNAVLAEVLGAARCAAAVVAGDLQCGYAYPLLGGERALPLAACLRQDKELPERDWRNELATAGPDPDAQWKALRGGYAVYAREPVAWCQPALQSWTHNTIDDAVQRPTAEVGGVYTFEAIPAGLRYASVLRLRCAAAERQGLQDRLSTALTGRSLRLGAARNSDYGLVRVGAVQAIDTPQAAAADKCLVLLALSDLIVRDARDNCRADAQTWLHAVQREAQRHDPAAKLALPCGGASARFVVPRRIDGWNTRHRAHRNSLVAIAAGSVLQIALETALPDVFLRALAAGGLGERRGEGFGEIAVNPAWLLPAGSLAPGQLAHARRQAADTAAIAQSGDAGDEASKKLLDALARRAWHRWIDEQAARRAFADEKFCAGVLGFSKESPGNAQLGNLLDQLRGVRRLTDVARLREWVGKLKASKRGDAWKSSLHNWLEPLANGGEPAERLVWSWLDDDGRQIAALAKSTYVKEAWARGEFFALALNSVVFAAVHRLRRAREADGLMEDN